MHLNFQACRRLEIIFCYPFLMDVDVLCWNTNFCILSQFLGHIILFIQRPSTVWAGYQLCCLLAFHGVVPDLEYITRSHIKTAPFARLISCPPLSSQCRCHFCRKPELSLALPMCLMIPFTSLSHAQRCILTRLLPRSLSSTRAAPGLS